MSMKYSDVEKLLESGLISQEQKDAIVERLKLSSAASRNYLMIALSSVGGLLVLAGLILLISANWENIPPLAKQISGIVLMLAFWIFGLKFICGKNPRPILGESLCLVGAGMWLANIALYGQIYQISSEPSKAIGAWFSGIFLIPWLVRLRGVLVLSLVAAAIWLGFKIDEIDGGKDAVSYFCFLAFFTGVSALGIFVGNLKDSVRERFRGYGPLATWTAFPILIFMAQIFCYGEVEFYLPALVALVPATAILLASLLVSFWKKLNKPGVAAAILLGTFPLMPLVLSYADIRFSANDDFLHAVMMGTLFVCGSASMLLGAQSARKFYVNLGALMILLAALALVVEVVGSLTSSGFSLIIAGTLLLVFGYFLERGRREITAKIQAEKLSENQ